MIYVDVHAHLDMVKDVDSIVNRAKEAGVKAIITNGTSVERNRLTLELASKYDIVKAALGLYPVEALKLSTEEIDSEIEFIKKNKDKIVALGEVGLDYHWVKDKNEEQQAIFDRFVSLSEKIKKPMLVHSRKAEEDVISMLESSNASVVMHCFGGGMRLVKRCADNGWSFSIPANVVRSESFQKIVKLVNVNQLLTETDTPYLSPFKDKPSEPAFVVEGLSKMASLKGFTAEDMANAVYLNYQRLF